ncbi:MAG: single-stranded-DNA-specific exonuclease RecJ [Minisyncoccia bacterium]
MEKYSELIQTLLQKRGITDEASAEIFLNPSYERDLHDPFLMRDMEKACVRIFEAMEAREKIVIYADYDCDGIPGAVILQDLFKKIGYSNFEVYIPQRNSEGYGLNLTAIKQFSESGVNLLITVDLGITAVEEVAQAKVDGIDVIITDHHIPQATLPHAYAILNPKVDEYPEQMLCGAGVAFKLVQGFLKKYGSYYRGESGVSNFLPAELATLKQSSSAKLLTPLSLGWEKWLLDMAGLATLSDMVPLLGENRAIASFGIKVLRKSPRPGLVKLLAKMSIDQRYLTEDDVGFMIAPRLNAASRMDNPLRAFELLATNDLVEADMLAKHLSKINDDRKLIVANIMREVGKKFELREMREVIVIGNPEWRVGVLGLVAGKICDEYKRPVFVWGRDENDCIKGSCRSEGSVSVVELMTETREYFMEFGGHEMAGGFTVDNKKIHFLEESLSLAFGKLKRDQKETEISFDVKAGLSIVNMRSWRDLEKLAPFGLANPKPIFFFEGVKIENLKKFGKNNSGEHLEIIFSDASNNGKNKIKAISFFSSIDSFKAPLAVGLSVNLLATFDLSHFAGREELRLRITDIL